MSYRSPLLNVTISQVLVPSTACILVMVMYIMAGTVMFAEWENWDYLDAAYFCVTSLLKAIILLLSGM